LILALFRYLSNSPFNSQPHASPGHTTRSFQKDNLHNHIRRRLNSGDLCNGIVCPIFNKDLQLSPKIKYKSSSREEGPAPEEATYGARAVFSAHHLSQGETSLLSQNTGECQCKPLKLQERLSAFFHQPMPLLFEIMQIVCIIAAVGVTFSLNGCAMATFSGSSKLNSFSRVSLPSEVVLSELPTATTSSHAATLDPNHEIQLQSTAQKHFCKFQPSLSFLCTPLDCSVTCSLNAQNREVLDSVNESSRQRARTLVQVFPRSTRLVPVEMHNSNRRFLSATGFSVPCCIRRNNACVVDGKTQAHLSSRHFYTNTAAIHVKTRVTNCIPRELCCRRVWRGVATSCAFLKIQTMTAFTQARCRVYKPLPHHHQDFDEIAKAHSRKLNFAFFRLRKVRMLPALFSASSTILHREKITVNTDVRNASCLKLTRFPLNDERLRDLISHDDSTWCPPAEMRSFKTVLCFFTRPHVAEMDRQATSHALMTSLCDLKLSHRASASHVRKYFLDHKPLLQPLSHSVSSRPSIALSSFIRSIVKKSAFLGHGCPRDVGPLMASQSPDKSSLRLWNTSSMDQRNQLFSAIDHKCMSLTKACCNSYFCRCFQIFCAICSSIQSIFVSLMLEIKSSMFECMLHGTVVFCPITCAAQLYLLVNAVLIIAVALPRRFKVHDGGGSSETHKNRLLGARNLSVSNFCGDLPSLKDCAFNTRCVATMCPSAAVSPFTIYDASASAQLAPKHVSSAVGTRSPLHTPESSLQPASEFCASVTNPASLRCMPPPNHNVRRDLRKTQGQPQPPHGHEDGEQRWCSSSNCHATDAVIVAVLLCLSCIVNVADAQEYACPGAWSTAVLSVARLSLAATSLPSQGIAIFAGGSGL
jgi:hypothetical protein